jgi:DNA-binding PadR family transcriptional regulator
MVMISNKEAVLLGLILEKPKHAYEVEKDIEERDMKYWTEISMSSVYKLLAKLEERKLLKSEVALSENNVAQKIYTITEKGEVVFKEKIKKLLSAWKYSVYPVDISLANLHRLRKRDVLQGLNEYLESLDKMIICYLDLERYLVEHKCFLGNVQLATRRVYLLKAEKKWLSKFMEEYKSGE